MHYALILLLSVLPTVSLAGDTIDFEIRLTKIEGVIEQYPLEFDYGLYLGEQEAVGAMFANQKRVSLDVNQISKLNSTGRLQDQDLSIQVRYKVLRPQNPYIVPNPIFINYNPPKEERKFQIDIEGKKMQLDEFYVIVRTDGWGASTWTFDLAMDIIEYLVQNSNVASKSFDLGDDGVNYHFEVSRVNAFGTATCGDGTCEK